MGIRNIDENKLKVIITEHGKKVLFEGGLNNFGVSTFSVYDDGIDYCAGITDDKQMSVTGEGNSNMVPFNHKFKYKIILK